MDGNNCDQNGKHVKNPSAESHNERRSKEYPTILRPKFMKKKGKKTNSRTHSKESATTPDYEAEECTARRASLEKVEEEEGVTQTTPDEVADKKELTVDEKKGGKEDEEEEIRVDDMDSLDETVRYSRERVFEEEEKPKDTNTKKKPLREKWSKESDSNENHEKLAAAPKRRALSRERADDDEKPGGGGDAAGPKKKQGRNLSKELIETTPPLRNEEKRKSKERDTPKDRERDKEKEEKEKREKDRAEQSKAKRKANKAKKSLRKLSTKKSRPNAQGQGSHRQTSRKAPSTLNKKVARTPDGCRNSPAALRSTQPHQQHLTTPPQQQLIQSQQVPTKPIKRKKQGFGFKEFLKLKFFRRRSDCVAQPTKEMLVKPVVQPEYDPADPRDFQPDPRYLFHDDRDFELRLKNARCKRDEIFVNFRPFWLMRTPDDVPPRSRMIEASEHLAHSRPTSPLLKDFPPPRRQKFFDPRTDELGKMMAIDASIGVNLNDAGKEKELARIRSNTIHAVVAVQTYRKSAEGKRRMDEIKTESITDEKERERAAGNLVRKIAFIQSEKPDKLHVYSRKDRPGAGKCRKFTRIDYAEGRKGAKRRVSLITIKSVGTGTF